MTRTASPPRLQIPPGTGPFHFIGLGGIGMSGIAEIVMDLGFAVQGSDLKASAITDRLAARGARVFVGQAAANVAGAGVVVVSTAIRPDNPELVAARAQGLPVIHRSDMLAELMRMGPTVAVAGTHGKTTTTTMVATMLDAGGFDPTVINGGVIHAYGSNARLGQGQWVVAEADESDGSFNRLPVTVGIVTNIDPEHLEHWGSFDALRDGFRRFVRAVPFYGRAVLCVDHPLVAELAAETSDKPVTTFGLKPGADLVAIGLRFEKGKALFDILVNLGGKRRIIENCELPMPGDHNVSNALSAVAVALHLGMSDGDIRAALAGFQGVGRRFTRVGQGRGITVIDDYGHHPVEIAAVLRAARQSVDPGARVIAVHQPHRYTRLSSLFQDFAACFDGADAVGLLPVYPAGEDPIPGATTDALLSAMAARGRSGQLLTSQEDLLDLVRAQGRPGDMVVCLGAGTISAWAQALPGRLGD
jgi:UDP-N-acetylmuramate--alanine ligase